MNRHIAIVVLTFIIFLLLPSCKSTQPLQQDSQQQAQTQVLLSGANYHIVGPVKGNATLTDIKRDDWKKISFLSQNLTSNALADMFGKAQLQGSQAIAYITTSIETKQGKTSDKIDIEAKASGTIIEFDYENGETIASDKTDFSEEDLQEIINSIESKDQGYYPTTDNNNQTYNSFMSLNNNDVEEPVSVYAYRDAPFPMNIVIDDPAEIVIKNPGTAIVQTVSASKVKIKQSGTRRPPMRIYTRADIPDENFYSHLITFYDANKDGMISEAEAAKIETLEMQNMGIKNLRGIEYLHNLKHIYARYNLFATADLSKNVQLQTVYLRSNSIKRITLPRNANIVYDIKADQINRK